MKNNTKEIINFLYNLEFMSPFYPTENIIYESKSEKDLNKILTSTSKNKKPNYKIIYSIFLGLFNYDESIEKIYNTLNLHYKKNPYLNTKSIAMGFKIEETGKLISNTLSLSNCIYAINKILTTQKTDIILTESEVSKINLNLSKNLNEINILANLNNILKELLTKIKEIFPLLKDKFTFTYIITKEEIYQKDNNMTVIPPAILPSFYLSDLDHIRQNITPKISEFLSLTTQDKIEIDKNIAKIKETLNPDLYPLGKWPSTYHPSLMQQIAINLSLTKTKQIFSVNGPPGTGKTTLAKELIADIIVKRAQNLATYEKPDDAFLYQQTEPNSNYFKLDSKLTEFGILVASNNNKAVEKITLELQLNIEKANTTLFSKTKNNPEIYLTDLSDILLEKDTWGLISIPLGKQENIKRFNTAIWYGKDNNPTIRSKMNDNLSNFTKTKKQFLNKLNEVEEYRKYIKNINNDVLKQEETEIEIKNQKKRIKELNYKINELTSDLKKYQKDLEYNEKQEKDLKELLYLTEKSIPLFFKIFRFIFPKNHHFIKLNEITNQLIANKNNHMVLQNEISKKEKSSNILNEELKNENQQLNKSQTELTKIIQNLKKYQKEGFTFGNIDYFKNITKNQKSQEACIWTNKHYDTLREELFYYALQLQKSFILSSNRFKFNLSLLVNALSGNMNDDLKKESYTDLLNTLFLLSPVVSTTLASIQKFLFHIKEDEIAYLILDEAGQATPGSVLGAINRAKKSIILGDPFQIEPVVSTPIEVYNLLNHNKKIPPIFNDNTLSVQILGDLQNQYGTLRKATNTWIGCPLLLHRRCLNPMFDIANQIAYENTMFYGTINNNPPKELTFKKSSWLDIKGEPPNEKSHYIKEQGKKVLEILKDSLKNNNYEFPKIFIITPFKDVSNSLRKELNIFLKSHTNYEEKEIKD